MTGTMPPVVLDEFQLTLPIRGAIGIGHISIFPSIFQLTLPIRGAIAVTSKLNGLSQFQLTLPIRGAINAAFEFFHMIEISTHAPHTGSDGRAG